MVWKFLSAILACFLGSAVMGESLVFAAKKEPVPKKKEPPASMKGPAPYLGRDYRDPTLNPLLTPFIQKKTKAAEEVVRLPTLSVQGVIWSPEGARAIVEERVVAKGDILPEGIEILDITGAGVKVLYRGKIFTILPEGVVEER